ncbi:Rgp1-domain-containing protein [Epithele typhae]|uniref:Rgp1-domain-containing protein n=1 Tax=Epithele typhae TaxID=378194 RepID=UPI0020079A43|nr:Rgp1-domain-containing protein [Epithele typhae]KAH9927442.1 Rgp1-domain-containing protein [Epithele typhae]
MAGSSSMVVDEAIRVVVTPSQASYFAGEPFSVTITFTNTRTPEAPPAAPRSSSQIHRRGAHSISSVPLSRPPTSPDFSEGRNSAARKGLIGHGLPAKVLDGPPSADVLRKRLLASRSLSVSLPASDLSLPGSSHTNSPTSPANQAPSPLNGTSPLSGQASQRIAAPLARTPTLPPNHPHARKNSVLDGQLQLQDLRPPPSMSPFSPTPNPSVSAFSLSLDPIEEASSTSPGTPNTPYIPSPVGNHDMANVRTHIASGPSDSVTKQSNGYAYPPRDPPHRPSQLGLGRGPPPSPSTASLPKVPRTAFSSSFPALNNELILYAYAQISGSLVITPLPDASTSPNEARNLNRLRSRLLKRKAVGGGSMDISSSLTAPGSPATGPSRRSHGRSTSLSGTLFSVLAPGAGTPPSQQPFVPGHRARNPSMFSLFSNVPPPAPSRSVGSSLAAPMSEDEEVDPDVPLPTLEVQQSMLAVDLNLGPGESRTYTYSLALPSNLPPTFRGRALKFSYQFILGICRAGSSAPGTSPSSSSRVMKVPIRVYNHVAVGRPPLPYNLLWPVQSQRRPMLPGKVTEGKKDKPKGNGLRAIVAPSTSIGTYDDLKEYARNLLASFPDPQATGVRIKLPIEAIPPSRNGTLDRDLDVDPNNATGCRQAVEVLTRNPKKASYDVNKDGVRVAVLTFPKSAYRLGETILGVVELNERPSRARVLKLSAMLEAHESLPSSIASPALARHMRRVHAEHHSCFMPATLRSTFSLDIPPDATPAFEASFDESFGDGLGSLNVRPNKPKSGGLEWKVRLCVRTRHLVQDGTRGQWGSSWKAAPTIAPLERPVVAPSAASSTMPAANGEPTGAMSWVSYLTSSLLGPSNAGYHDGDEDLDDPEGEVPDDMGSEEAWRDLKVEMVECEVPVKVWPANTAFKATEVVFDV